MLNKINILLKQDKKLFHTQDLALLWNITNRNTLLTTIKRYVKKHILYSIYKGFYSVVPVKQLDAIELGICALHDFSYLSTESVLVQHGIIQQQINYITLLSNVSRTFQIGGYYYKVRKLKDEFLFNETGISVKNGIKIADLERAVTDMLYYNKYYYFDGQELIDWDKVEHIKKMLGYK